MYLKYNRDEVEWIDQKYLSREFAKDLGAFWVNTDNRRLYCARRLENGEIGHFYFDRNINDWVFDYEV